MVSVLFNEEEVARNKPSPRFALVFDLPSHGSIHSESTVTNKWSSQHFHQESMRPVDRLLMPTLAARSGSRDYSS